MRFILLALVALSLAACASEPKPAPESPVIVQRAAPPPPLAVPAECRPARHGGPTPVRKVPGGTPPEAVEQALIANIKTLKGNRVLTNRCYCTLAKGNVTDSDKAEARRVCSPSLS